MQNLVAKGRMWEQLLMYMYLVLPLGLGYATLVPMYHGLGFAVTQLVAWSVFATALVVHKSVFGQSDQVAVPNAADTQLLTGA